MVDKYRHPIKNINEHKEKIINFEIMISEKVRYQKGLSLIHLYPSVAGKCACGCGEFLEGRKKRWASRECNNRVYEKFAILKGNNSAIRKALFELDNGFCRSCGVFDEKWEADHIIPVFKGGGLCGIDNFQTLCPHCHKAKTSNQTLSQRA